VEVAGGKWFLFAAGGETQPAVGQRQRPLLLVAVPEDRFLGSGAGRQETYETDSKQQRAAHAELRKSDGLILLPRRRGGNHSPRCPGPETLK
jgi:hypothetical protein